VLWYQLLGIPAPPCADRGCTNSCSSEGKAHWHNMLRGSAKPPTSTGESPYYLEIEKGLQHNTWRRRITSLKLNSQLSCCTCSCCNGSKAAAIAALHFLSILFTFSPLSSLYTLHILTPLLLSVCYTLLLPIYRQEWCHQLQHFFNKGGCQPLTSWMGAHGWCNSSCSCCNCQWLLHINGNQPNSYMDLQATGRPCLQKLFL